MLKGTHNTKSIFAKEAGWFIWIFAQLLQQISFTASSAFSGKTKQKKVFQQDTNGANNTSPKVIGNNKKL